MTEHEIKIYLRDTTSLTEDQMELIAYQVKSQLDYTNIYDQIDQIKDRLIDSWTWSASIFRKISNDKWLGWEP